MCSYFSLKGMSLETVEWTSTETSSNTFYLLFEQAQSILKHVTIYSATLEYKKGNQFLNSALNKNFKYNWCFLRYTWKIVARNIGW